MAKKQKQVPTPIELLADIIEDTSRFADGARVDEVLVPEQCAIIVIGGRRYHVTIEEVSRG